MTRRFLFLAAMVCGMVTTTAHAQKVSEAQALQRAKAFLNGRVSVPTGGKQYAPQGVTSLTKASEGDAYYVFNAGDNGGFVIVSSDERLGTVLGYSTEGRFDAEAVPDNMRAWLKGYDKSVEVLQATEDHTDGQATASRRASKAAIAPLIKTKWSQGWPYNLLTPEKDGQQCVTGCVATSMAMLMNYWQHPATTAKTIPAWSGLSAVPSGTKIKWSSMSDYYGSSEWFSLFVDAEDTYYNEVWAETTEEQQQAVAELMRMCGMAVNMDYGVDESKAQATAPLSALKDYFGYKNEMKFLLQDSYTIENWEQIIYNELQQKRPVMYGGIADDFGFTGGHSFLVDGYDGNGFFHINWGLASGMGHGYYSLAAQRFYQQTSAIVGIQPTAGGTIANVPTAGAYTTDAKVLKLTGVATDGPVWAIETLPGCGNVVLTLANSGNQLFKGVVAVSATDDTGMSAYDNVLAEVPAKGSAQVTVPYYEFQFAYGKNTIRVADNSTGEYIDGEYTINVERQRLPNLDIEYTLDGVNDKGLITYSTPCTLRYKITSQWAGDPNLKARLCMRLPSGEETVRELGHITFGKAVEGSIKVDAPNWDPLPDYSEFAVNPRVEFYSDTRTHEFMDYYYQNGTQDADRRMVVFCKKKPIFASEPQKADMEKLDGLNKDMSIRPAGYYVLGHNGFVGFNGISLREDIPEYYNSLMENAWRDYQEGVSYYTGILRCGESSTKNLGLFDCPSDKPYSAGSIQRTLNGKTVYFPYNLAGVKEAAQRGLYKNEVGMFLPYEGWLDLLYSGGAATSDDVFDDCYLYYYPIVGEETGIVGISDNSRQKGTDKVYDLTGRRLTQPTKPGVYVKDGRKVLVK